MLCFTEQNSVIKVSKLLVTDEPGSVNFNMMFTDIDDLQTMTPDHWMTPQALLWHHHEDKCYISVLQYCLQQRIGVQVVT